MTSPPPRRRGSFTEKDASRAGVGRLSRAKRGQSVALEYTLSLAVASLVITGLFLAAGDFVTSQREDVVRTELGVIGEQLAGDIAAADRLAQAGETTGALSINASIPSTVAGASYVIEVQQTGSSTWLNLSTEDPDVLVRVRLETETPVKNDRIQGGEVSVVYASNQLEVRG